MKAANILIKGKLPFIVLLEDSINEKGIPIGEKAIELVSNDGSLMVGLFFRKKINNDQKNAVLAIEDLYGEFTYSEFIIDYQRRLTRNNSLEDFFYRSNHWDLESIAIYTAELLNKFIEIYKTITNHNKDWIPFLTHYRLSPISIHIINDNDERIGGIEILDYRGTGLSLGNVLNPEQLNELKNLSRSSGLKFDPANKFIQESNRYFLTGDFISSILFSAFYIEKWIFREVRYRLLKKGKGEEEINQLFINKKGQYIDRYEAIKFVTQSMNFKNSNEFKEFTKNVSDIRDEIVHRERTYVSQEMAIMAAKSTMMFRDFLLKEIWDK